MPQAKKLRFSQRLKNSSSETEALKCGEVTGISEKVGETKERRADNISKSDDESSNEEPNAEVTGLSETIEHIADKVAENVSEMVDDFSNEEPNAEVTGNSEPIKHIADNVAENGSETADDFSNEEPNAEVTELSENIADNVAENATKTIDDFSDEELNVKVTVKKSEKLTPFDTSDNSSSEDECDYKRKSRPPAWVDEGDIYTCQEVIDIQGRKCNVGTNASKDYKKTLEEKYKEVMGIPKWAQRKQKQDDSLSRSGNLVKKSTALQKGTIELQKLKDLNRESYAEGPVLKSVLFHPSSTVGLVAGVSGIVSLFQVDGKSNTKLQSIQYRKFPISSASFIRGGEEFIVGSQYHHYFYSHDLISGQSNRIANLRITDITNMKNFRVTPDGKYIVVQGKFGNIHLLSSVTKEFICSLKMNGEVSSLAFSGTKMFSHGTEGEVYVWDMNTRQCVHKFIDDGCLDGTAIACSPSGNLLACASNTGVVNIYDLDNACLSMAPKPLKAVLNLVTPVNCVKFNATSEILCMLSDYKENAIKMLHCPSMTVFSNFPSFQAKFNRPQCADFSPNSGYLAFGDNRKTAHLFRLKYYGNY